MQTNPLTYKDVHDITTSSKKDPHAIGAIWATMMNEMYWNLRDFHGYTDNIFDAKSGKGNTMAIALMINGLMLQPCNPTFIHARDAIIQADFNINQGVNECILWRAFSKRGLGPLATSNYSNDFSLPSKCQ
jgi:extracellular elastinolytic metalloproteinase